jgi:hypothetical protein
MPYLSCPSCRLTVYNPPTIAAPERCPRCNVRLSVQPAAMFAQSGSVVPLADELRRRASERGGGQK